MSLLMFSMYSMIWDHPAKQNCTYYDCLPSVSPDNEIYFLPKASKMVFLDNNNTILCMLERSKSKPSSCIDTSDAHNY